MIDSHCLLASSRNIKFFCNIQHPHFTGTCTAQTGSYFFFCHYRFPPIYSFIRPAFCFVLFFLRCFGAKKFNDEINDAYGDHDDHDHDDDISCNRAVFTAFKSKKKSRSSCKRPLRRYDKNHGADRRHSPYEGNIPGWKRTAVSEAACNTSECSSRSGSKDRGRLLYTLVNLHQSCLPASIPTGIFRKQKAITRINAVPVRTSGFWLNANTYPMPRTVPGTANVKIEENCI